MAGSTTSESKPTRCDLGTQVTQRAVSHAASRQEDVCRKAQAGESSLVPVRDVAPPAVVVDALVVLVGLLAAEQEVEVVGHHEEGVGGGKLLWVLVLEGAELVGRVERLVLHVCARSAPRSSTPGTLKLLANAWVRASR